MTILSIIFAYFKKASNYIRFRAGIVLLLVFLNSFLETLSSLFIFPFIMLISGNHDSANGSLFAKLNLYFQDYNSSDLIFYYSCFLLIFYAFKTLFSFSVQKFQFNFIYNLLLEESLARLNDYLTVDYQISKSLHSSLVIRNIATDVQNFHLNFLMPFLTLISETAVFSMMIFALLLIYPFATIYVTIALGLTSYIFIRLVKQKVRNFGIQEKVEGARKISGISDIVSLYREIKVYGAELFFLDKYKKIEESFTSASRYSMLLNQTPRLFVEFITFALLFSSVILMVLREIDLNIFLPILSIFAIVAVRLLPSINRITQSYSRMIFYKSSSESIFHGATMIQETSVNNDYQYEGLEGWKSIRIKNLSFGYDQSESKVFQNLNFEIGRNQILCITGSSGSGKSTFVEILLGLLKPSEGKILVDDHDIQQCMSEWQSRLAYIPQDIYLMDVSIRENLLFGSDGSIITDDIMWEILEKVQLSKYFQSVGITLDFKVGENGCKFSGGQKQRIAIARALIRGADIIVMDESTSALDNETEQFIIDVIRDASSSATFIIIAHKALTINNADCVVDFNKTITN